MIYLEKAKEESYHWDKDFEGLIIANFCPDEYFGLPHKCSQPKKFNKDCRWCWNREMPEVKEHDG